MMRRLFCVMTLSAAAGLVLAGDAPKAKKPAPVKPQAPAAQSAPATPAGQAAPAAPAENAEQEKKAQTKEGGNLGMSILGNQEAPKALVIVPWKSSELG